MTGTRPPTAAQQEYAALTGTHWIRASTPADAVTVPGTPGTWYADGDAVIGTGLPDGLHGTVRLAPGDRVIDDGTVLAGHARAGVPALRVFDPSSVNARTLAGVEVFPDDPAWRAVDARFTPDPQVVTVVSADGAELPGEAVGWLTFAVPGDGTGRTRRLQVTGTDTGYFVSFADAGRGDGTHAFRFLDVPAADADGRTVIDFTAARLPPYAFSDSYLCPLPAEVNVLDVAVPAGERRVVRVHSTE